MPDIVIAQTLAIVIFGNIRPFRQKGDEKVPPSMETSFLFVPVNQIVSSSRLGAGTR